MAVGLFAVTEVIYVGARLRHVKEEILPLDGKVGMTREEWSRSWRTWLRGTALGLPFGALPAGGAQRYTPEIKAVPARLRAWSTQLRLAG